MMADDPAPGGHSLFDLRPVDVAARRLYALGDARGWLAITTPADSDDLPVLAVVVNVALPPTLCHVLTPVFCKELRALADRLEGALLAEGVPSAVPPTWHEGTAAPPLGDVEYTVLTDVDAEPDA